MTWSASAHIITFAERSFPRLISPTAAQPSSSLTFTTPHHDLPLRICETALPCAYYYALFLSQSTVQSLIYVLVGILPTRPNRAHCVAIAIWDSRRGKDRSHCAGFSREGSSRFGGGCCCRAGPRTRGRFCQEAWYPESIRWARGVSTYVIHLSYHAGV